ncbi:MAG: tetratricopeptide repeat protein [Bryobacteraceae bacterium]
MMQNRPIYISGKVVMEDGTPPPESVVIERVCNGTPKPEGYTDSKGRFSFQLGQNTAMMADASSGGADSAMPGMRSGGIGGMNRGISERDLMGCEIRAQLPGFRSENVSLAGRRSLDNPDVGTILMRRLAKVDGFTFSGTTLFAPKDAKKAFEKGRELAKKKKLLEAERELAKAVELYPKFAVAWYELGLAYQQQNKIDEALRAYGEAVKADGKYVNPYAQLSMIAAAQAKWEEAAGHSATLIKLNPYFSPQAYYLSGISNFNLKRLDIAEEHTREAVKMDTGRRNPRAQYLLGVILAQKADFGGAADNLRGYLKLVPAGGDTDRVKEQLAEVEKRIAAKQGSETTLAQ